ncbi:MULTISPECIES: excisionase family DNA-binding protein [unclassified Bacillus (in: firmicutes)]|uniref:excisionase family DNA-binding protein n=1 Tax=unclassified Bacillus (in: firmicutes) TaxID=185979 RepID=UPI0008DFAD2F|nr:MULTISPECIES: excisionase family DNA-binding protein [unclassified Bacillus (in: firmicutes)]SFA70228.1 DNA binding domain-containing protein, excisionase family [Bacillus sp. UNCCL13]SFQ59802.1 DNA binding domain-containing protein, excisionase family [Bacillus sp. cl95]
MYLTIKETAEYLSMPEAYVENLVQQKKIRALFDGEKYMIYKEQFNKHFEQVEKYKILLDEWKSEPLKEDIDVKDED